MRLSIRSKLIIAISTLVVILFSIASSLFINEKKRELADDIFINTLTFSRLTAPSIAYFYDLYLAQNSFVYFNREISEIFQQNDDVNEIEVVTYDAEILYNSLIDVDKRYEGVSRIVNNETVLKQIKSENIAVATIEGDQFFVKIGVEGEYLFVDEFENPIGLIESGTLVSHFVIPANEKYSVVYTVDYTNMNLRVERMQTRIIYLAIFGIMLGMMMSFIMSGQITKPVLQLVEGARRIAKGDFKTRVTITTKDELSYLGEAFNQMAQDLEKSIEAKLYKERVTAELELATQIQDQILPNSIPDTEGLDLAAGLNPATEIGGDIYDFIPLSKERLLMYLGDVTGHGVPAGIVSSISSALFYGYASSTDLKQILLDVHNVLRTKTMPTMFLTLCLMDWDVVNKKFRYASAGHEQIIHYKASDKSASLKPAGGVALGIMLPDISATISVQDVDLEVGDSLIIYSDGIPEAWKNKEEYYGMERFQDTVARVGALSTAEEIKAAILQDVDNFREGYEQMDDITIMVVKRV